MCEETEKRIKMYGGKVFGFKVSDYALENGYLDYYTLGRIIGDGVLNNNVVESTGFENWELVSGHEGDEDEWYEIYQYYIISTFGYQFLSDYTDEIVYYNEELDMYVWGITHFGTAWDYVLTDIKLVEGGDA